MPNEEGLGAGTCTTSWCVARVAAPVWHPAKTSPSALSVALCFPRPHITSTVFLCLSPFLLLSLPPPSAVPYQRSACLSAKIFRPRFPWQQDTQSFAAYMHPNARAAAFAAAAPRPLRDALFRCATACSFVQSETGLQNAL